MSKETHEPSQQESTAILFHELRNLLGGIKGNVDPIWASVKSLLKSIEKNREASEMQLNLSVLEQSLRQINKKMESVIYCSKEQLVLLNNFLDWSKLQQTEVKLESKTFAMLRGVLNPLIAVFSAISEEKSIQFSTSLPLKDQWVQGDTHRITQILTNVLSNAIKFATPTSEKAATITLSLAAQTIEESYQLHFKIKNSCKGLSSDQISKLFTPYTQSDISIARVYGGTGLGLIVSQKLLALMQGKIVCTSLEKQWVEFAIELTLPIAPKPILNKKKRKGQRPPLKIRPLLNAAVLLVEDNKINQEVAIAMLEKFGCTVEAANDGEQALILYAKGKHDLILMDIHMEGMNGIEATQAIREMEKQGSRPRIPIIGLSGDAFLEQQKLARTAGMDDYLSKPVSKKELYKKLVHYCRQTTQEQASPRRSPVLEEQKSGRSSPSTALFTRRRATPIRTSPSIIMASSQSDSIQECELTPLSVPVEFKHLQEISEIRLTHSSQQIAGNTEELKTVNPSFSSHSRAGFMARLLPASVSAPQLGDLNPHIRNHATSDLRLFNPLITRNTEDKETPIQEARTILQLIDSAFRSVLTGEDPYSARRKELQDEIRNLTRCYQSAPVRQRLLIATAALGCWQSLRNQITEKMLHGAVESSILQTADSHLDAWKHQTTLLEQDDQITEPRRSLCCAIS
jgi:CheY-like chemotaxis protein